MLPSQVAFQRSIDQQIRINRARTPSERLDALCQLMDAAKELAPAGAEAEQRRRLVAEARNREKERWREQFRQLLAARRADAEDD